MFLCLRRKFLLKTIKKSHRGIYTLKYGNKLKRHYSSLITTKSSFKKHNKISRFIFDPCVIYTSKYNFSSDNFLTGSSGEYVEKLYEKFLEDPSSVDSSFGTYFTSGEFFSPKSSSIKAPSFVGGSGTFDLNSNEAKKAINDATNLLKLARSYQAYGHFMATLDPLGILQQGVDRRQFKPELLNYTHWGFDESDMDRPIFVGDHTQFNALMGTSDGWVTLRDVINKLKSVYCGSIGYQYMHIANNQKNNYMRQMIEGFDWKFDKIEKQRILDRLMWATLFEKFLDIKYPAQKRFGIIGAESIIVSLKEIIDEGARLGIRDFIIGMPHRGRLLTLMSVMRKPLEQILHEFKGLALPGEEINESGDVKYHLGYSCTRKTPDEIRVHLSLMPNPSHLECINPVVMGKARAKQWYKKDLDRSKTMAILLHGDASFAGQGVVYESMALTELDDYTTGGVIHLIVNNQIGFTTDPIEARSSPYCTDVARSIAAPIMHVNGDDPESVSICSKMAVRFRQTFKTDSIIDLLCFRRYGHNEGDEPSFTQPLMYQIIDKKIKENNTVLELYKKKLINENTLTNDEIKFMEDTINNKLNNAYENSASPEEEQPSWIQSNWEGIVLHNMDGTDSPTNISNETVEIIAKTLNTLPDGFTIHRKLKQILQKRYDSIINGTGIDWGTGEALAYGSLLLEGIHVRLSGQDSERGTFSHRHAVLHEQKNIDKNNTSKQHRPLCHLPNATGEFRIMNSNLSEFAVLGFEYGYSTEHPQSLVLWEAQFGDFANGAQVIFDQFISSAERKWLRQSGLVMLLPHGYEGGGPEHSSARIERYLQMCNDNESEVNLDYVDQLQHINWQIVNCTTPANFFHALRRQVHRDFRKPLIVFTPKFGLRHPIASSNISDFTQTQFFKRLIPDNQFGLPNGFKQNDKIRKLVFVSGKLWINLMDYREKQAKEGNIFDDIIIDRIEQLSPFPYDLIIEQSKLYPNAQIIWAQEEPKNMGPWTYVCPRLYNATNANKIYYIGRDSDASPAVGYPIVDKQQHNKIIQSVFS